MHKSAAHTAISRRAALRGGVTLGIGLAAMGLADGGPAAAAGSGRKIRLADRGQTHYQLYLGSGEDVVTRNAAAELASYLQQITTASFEVVVGETAPSRPQLIVVGRGNPLAPKVGADVNYNALGDDGFAVRTQGQTVLIAGPNSRGTLYGVYWLLDHMLGVRWYAPDCTRVPDAPSLTLPVGALNGDHVPHYRYRCILYKGSMDPAYRQHNRLNGAKDDYWTTPVPPGIDTWDHYWAEEVHGSFKQVVPDPTLTYGGQLLCMDERTREAAAAALIPRIQQRIDAGQGASTAFYQNDSEVWTADPASQAFADAHGGALSAPIVDMLNDVIGRVR